MWLDKVSQWDRLIPKLLAADEAGFDTETYNQPYKTSPQHRTKIHCWSIAILGPTFLPRGYHRAGGVVLPRSALDYEPLVFALRAITLWAHNAPHDEHSARNEGLGLVVHDSLQWARVAVPGMRDYGLKEMRVWALGKPARKDYKTLMSYVGTETVERQRTTRRCLCGKVPCRSKSTSQWQDPSGTWLQHERVEVRESVQVQREVKKMWEAPDMVPGHPLFPEWEDYSRIDAEDGIEIVDWLRHRKPGNQVYPWSKLDESTLAQVRRNLPTFEARQ